MKLSDNLIIRELANIDPTLMQFFSPVERAIIEICRKVVEDSGGSHHEQ